MVDMMTAILLVSGGIFAMVAAIGVLRLPDLLIRMHASTKAGTLGTGLILAAVALHTEDFGLSLRALATIAFLLLTAPVAAHIIGRTGYWSGCHLWKNTVIDELGEAQECPWRQDIVPPVEKKIDPDLTVD